MTNSWYNLDGAAALTKNLERGRICIPHPLMIDKQKKMQINREIEGKTENFLLGKTLNEIIVLKFFGHSSACKKLMKVMLSKLYDTQITQSRCGIQDSCVWNDLHRMKISSGITANPACSVIAVT